MSNVPHTTVYVTPPPWGSFPGSIARQPRGCRYRTVRLRKAFGEMLSNADVFDTDTIPTAVEISSMEIGLGRCDLHRLIRSADS